MIMSILQYFLVSNPIIHGMAAIAKCIAIHPFTYASCIPIKRKLVQSYQLLHSPVGVSIRRPGKHGLIALPNNSKILGKTNSILFSVLQGACGCSSKALELVSGDEGKPIWVSTWEENSIVKLLQEASLLRNRP
eukprot:Gb_04331 [translate_table: standard]